MASFLKKRGFVPEESDDDEDDVEETSEVNGDDDEEDDDDSSSSDEDTNARVRGRPRAVASSAGGGGGGVEEEEELDVPEGRTSTYTNKQRVLIISSRGITARYRHLLEDFKKLIPHHKKDNKLDVKGDIQTINEIADMKSCNQILYLETRKKQDLYMYLSKTPHGPSCKFYVVNIHTMDELKLTGNCMIGSRPLLNFDTKFDSSPHWSILKTLLTDAFGTPNGHPKSKPFVDRVMSFFVVKNNIWVRNYQIMDKNDREEGKDTHLVEIGPRFVLVPIRIFSGSLGGATLYQNLAYVSPNEERAEKMKFKGDRYVERVEQKKARKEHLSSNPMPKDVMANHNVFK